MQYALDTIQSVSCVCDTEPDHVYLDVNVCVDAEKKKDESLRGICWRWSGMLSDKRTSLRAYLPD